MKRTYYTTEKDGFCGAYYPAPKESHAVLIAMMGDSTDDYMARGGVKWLHFLGCNVLAAAPENHDYSHHNFPIERFGKMIETAKALGNEKIGVLGASTTGMLALIAASFYPDITFTAALSASDFVMEGFYIEKGVERPGNGESTVSAGGKPLPFLPFAYRHPEYSEQLRKEAKRGRNMIASREMFDLSEKLHPLTEEEMIRIENIRGHVVVIGAEDDCLWDTCRYMRRMKERLRTHPHTAKWDFLFYMHGTHFVFPQGMMKKLLPVGSGLLVSAAFSEGRKWPLECRHTRIDIDAELTAAVSAWMR